MRKPKWLRPYLPNSSKRLALVGSSPESGDEPDMRAYWPMRLTQIVGGKRWSISFIWHTEPHPILVKRMRDELIASLSADAEQAELRLQGDPMGMVLEMHEHLGAHVNYGTPSIDIPDDLRDIRIALLDEEVGEYRDAAKAGDLVGIADGLADLVYVAYGTAHTYGIPLDAVLAEVHRSNMTKRSNPDGGKFIKGPDFSPADVKAVLENRR